MEWVAIEFYGSRGLDGASYQRREQRWHSGRWALSCCWLFPRFMSFFLNHFVWGVWNHGNGPCGSNKSKVLHSLSKEEREEKHTGQAKTWWEALLSLHSISQHLPFLPDMLPLMLFFFFNYFFSLQFNEHLTLICPVCSMQRYSLFYRTSEDWKKMVFVCHSQIQQSICIWAKIVISGNRCTVCRRTCWEIFAWL